MSFIEHTCLSREEFEDRVRVIKLDAIRYEPMMGMDSYVLFKDGTVHKAESSEEKYALISLNGCGGMSTKIAQSRFDRYRISTVFLSMDHKFTLFGGAHEPDLFETMVFESINTGMMIGACDKFQVRYSTYADALEGHEKVMQWLEKLAKSAPESLLSPSDLEREIATYFYKKKKRGSVVQRQETTGSKPVQCGFESHQSYQKWPFDD